MRNFSKRDQTMPTADEIYAKVTRVLVQALGVEELPGSKHTVDGRRR